MKLFELEQNDIATAYYDPSLDEINSRKTTDVRKDSLDLRAINRLKKMRAVQRLENLQREDLLGIMYSPPEADAGGGGGGFGF